MFQKYFELSLMYFEFLKLHFEFLHPRFVNSLKNS